MNCCLVIPSFQDLDRLKVFLPELVDALLSYEHIRLLVVDDGSGKHTAAATKTFVELIVTNHSAPIECLCLPQNVGKGGAIYAGWNSAGNCEWLGFIDADGATSAGEVLRIIRRIEMIESSMQDVDGVIASRVKMLGRCVVRNSKRHIVGRSFATLTSAMIGMSIYDSQCGCKFFRKKCYETVKPLLCENRFGFDIELLFHILRRGFRLEEFPVDWFDVPGSKVSLFKDSWLMFRTLLKIRLSAEKQKISSPTN